MNNIETDPKYKYLLDKTSDEESVDSLIEIVRVLRKECPWDREQTHESLKKCLIEEAYEVCDAIDKKDTDLLKEELGDVLLQVIFHSIIEEENCKFSLSDVASGVSEKMIRRHPHIFSKEKVKTIDKALEKWENMKRQEKLEMTTSDIMNAIPKALPALTKSYKIQEKAANVGFDWNDIQEAFKKVEEETNELQNAYRNENHEEITEEVGDLIFSAVNVARFMGVDPEEALNNSSRKFIDRFSYIEEEADSLGRTPEKMSLEELDELWEKAKSKEKQSKTK